MSLNTGYGAALKKLVADQGENVPTERYLNRGLRMLAKWRSRLIANTLIAREGAVVLNGPFAGMKYGRAATEGSLAARLLGSYESELHPTIESLARSGLEVVVDIGCAEGFYAVGFARLMPSVEVHAFDIDPQAREQCALLAAENGVSDRVRIGGEFRPEDFESFKNRRTLVFVDAEGAEDELLDPSRQPSLGSMTVIVETHEHERRGVIGRLTERFAPTHDIERLEQGPKTTPLPAWFAELGHLDQLLAAWEWRAHPTPWLVMRPRSATVAS